MFFLTSEEKIWAWTRWAMNGMSITLREILKLKTQMTHPYDYYTIRTRSECRFSAVSKYIDKMYKTIWWDTIFPRIFFSRCSLVFMNSNGKDEENVKRSELLARMGLQSGRENLFTCSLLNIYTHSLISLNMFVCECVCQFYTGIRDMPDEFRRRLFNNMRYQETACRTLAWMY